MEFSQKIMKPTYATSKILASATVKLPSKSAAKTPVVSPPAPPAPVWQRLELPDNCDRFYTQVYFSHSGATVSAYQAGVSIPDYYYKLGDHINIIPPVGTWKEQDSKSVDTGVVLNQLQAGANNTTSINLTLDGGVGPAKLMRYLKV